MPNKYPVFINGKIRPSYRRWSNMIRRCYSPKSHLYKHYGGRGISVCERWRGPGGHDNFLDDMGEPPAGKWLERINNDGNYCQENCTWATPKQHAKNKRHRGIDPDPNTVANKARAAGLPFMVLIHRLRAGWSEYRALTEPYWGPSRNRGQYKALDWQI